ncbi:sialate O-acetylesterase [Zobellia galactanivorans]|uniref:Carbohydrate esterase, family CE6 n=1 Tax=Zobellia galactanivorans (strain DSM 12802 / CCUG 47099 / CIP 106680 / NCIMB 13871 / Dsij) TaxID=63186 RepID=G0L8K8_ZOBGA|nr:sialate O-acetylesterase [Zobellia galactanivorans]CAZ97644.1 Carbohydrate esterase, family CE6 [Zobellia galactanivorans]
MEITRYIHVFFLSLIGFSGLGQENQELPVKVFILGGQSNMDGTGKSEDLPEKYRSHPDEVMIWDNKKEKWVSLGTDSFSERRKFKFGPEIAFSHLMAKKFPNHTIAIVKTSGGGTKLWKHWLPGQPMYTRFLKNMDNALQNLKGQGVAYEVSGMLWMQGESDAETLEWANAYEENLKVLYKDVRKETGKKNLPIVMGRISIGLLRKTPWNFDHTEVVQAAQDKVAAEDKNVFIINTDKLETLNDNTHFNSESNIWLGEKMGKLMWKALK